jgi:DNA processing protein
VSSSLPPPSVLEGAALPPRLRDLRRPPRLLYVHGELPRGPCVAVVGTRHPTQDGRRYARELAGELAARGVTVLSGGAEGIDTAAHRGALDAGGTTVVIAPAGFEAPFPEENAALFRKVVKRGGAYVSLVPPATPAPLYGFFPRNACLVALAHVVVVVEAPFRSGARNAAKHARRLGRPLFVAAGPPWLKKSAGCTADLKLGARPLVDTAEVLDLLAEERLHPVAVRRDRRIPKRREQLEFFPGLAQEEQLARVLAAVRAGFHQPEQLCEKLGFEARLIQQLLLTLTLRGALVPDPNGSFRSTNK